MNTPGSLWILYLHQSATAFGLIEIPSLTQAIPGCLKRWVDSRRDPERRRWAVTDGWQRCLQLRGEGLSPLMHSHTLIGGQSCYFGLKRYHPLGSCVKREGREKGKNQGLCLFCPNLWKQSPSVSNRTCLTPGLDSQPKNGQIVIMLYAFQDILAKYLNSHLPVIVETTPGPIRPKKWQTRHSYKVADIILQKFLSTSKHDCPGCRRRNKDWPAGQGPSWIAGRREILLILSSTLGGRRPTHRERVSQQQGSELRFQRTDRLICEICWEFE